MSSRDKDKRDDNYNEEKQLNQEYEKTISNSRSISVEGEYYCKKYGKINTNESKRLREKYHKEVMIRG